jgi:hypothetical protein
MSPPTFLITSTSPLKIRSNIRRVSVCHHPWKTTLRLLWPVPWHLAPPTPVSVAELEEGGEIFIHYHRQQGIIQLRRVPLFSLRDTPFAALYRLYEDLCANDLIMMGYECEYFFFHKQRSWHLVAIPDPMDPDPIRYAILASMVDALVDAFNWRLELGLRRDGSIDESDEKVTNFEREEQPA